MVAKQQAKPKFAEGTTVSVERSQVEVQKVLKKYGATDTAYGENGDKASILFKMNGRVYRIEFSYPPLSSFRLSSRRTLNTSAQMEQARNKEMRRLWRALLMVVKSKLEAAQSGIVSFEEEFFAHTVLADNTTIGQWIEPRLQSGRILLLLPEMSNPRPEEMPDIIEGEII